MTHGDGFQRQNAVAADRLHVKQAGLKSNGEFDKLNIICGKDILENEYYGSMLTHTRLFNEDSIKLGYLPRLRAVDALAQLADVVLAHQISNPLNYSYLDALYLQFPLVHNAPMIKDAGY